jgi:hypothetical protein
MWWATDVAHPTWLLPDEILTHAMFCQWWWATKKRCPPYLACYYYRILSFSLKIKKGFNFNQL